MKYRIAKIALVSAMALSFALPAAAQTVTVAQLQAQINALMAQLSAMQGGGSTVTTTTYTTDLTIGSTGDQVSSLQQFLVSKGFLTMPNGVAYGYFGNLTKAAVAAWQAANGVTPSVGYFGAKSRAAISTMTTTTTTTTTTTSGVAGCTAGAAFSATTGAACGSTTINVAGCAAGASFSSTTGAACGSTTVINGTLGSITTPGIEGILNITAGPLSNTVLNVGQTMVPVLTIRAQAQMSDIAIGRIQVDLGTNTQLYNKIFSKIYAVDVATGQVLASSLLNSSTVAQSGSNYLVTLSGFSDVVKAGTYKDIAIKTDLYSSVDSAYLSAGTSAVVNTFTIDGSGVRGTDGAGIDQYGPINAIYQTVIVNKSLVDNANATISLAASTPLTNTVPVTDTTNGQYLQLPVLAFTVNANNDTLHLHNVSVIFTGTPSAGLTTATATAAYLYNGSTMVASASISPTTGIATFSNISDGTAGASIPAGTGVTFTVKADVTGVLSGSYNLTATYSDNNGNANTDIYNSTDGSIASTPASVAGNMQTVIGKGPTFTLVGAPTISKSLVSGTNTSTSTVLATFNLQIQSVGADTLLGLQASTTPTFTFGIYQNGVLTALQVSSSSAETVPSSGVTFSTGSYTISQGGIINLPVTFTFLGNTVAGTPLSLGSYAVGIQKMAWYTAGAAVNTTFSAGQTAWRTPAVSLPN